MADLVKMIPVSFCAAAAHSFSVFAQSAGAVSFAMIVKAAEPAFAALVGVFLYGKTLSANKWLCLIPVIGAPRPRQPSERQPSPKRQPSPVCARQGVRRGSTAALRLAVSEGCGE